MTRFVLFVAMLLPLAGRAQDIKIKPHLTAEESAAAFAAQPPDEGSPFFVEREIAAYALTKEGREATGEEPSSAYPKAKESQESVSTMFSKFFTDMFSSVRFHSFTRPDSTQKMTIEPKEFTLKDRREVTVNYTIVNNTKKIMRLDYPTTQRLEILTSDPQGVVVERWSDDRAFQPVEGIVFINPKERIEYSERIPTRDMKSGVTYSVEATVPENPQFIHRELITPQ